MVAAWIKKENIKKTPKKQQTLHHKAGRNKRGKKGGEKEAEVAGGAHSDGRRAALNRASVPRD